MTRAPRPGFVDAGTIDPTGIVVATDIPGLGPMYPADSLNRIPALTRVGSPHPQVHVSFDAAEFIRNVTRIRFSPGGFYS